MGLIFESFVPDVKKQQIVVNRLGIGLACKSNIRFEALLKLVYGTLIESCGNIVS